MPEIERQKRIGGLLDRWEVRPPQREPAPAEPKEGGEDQGLNEIYREAHWRARALIGPGAPIGAMAIVVEAIVNGASDDQALDQLAAAASA